MSRICILFSSPQTLKNQSDLQESWLRRRNEKRMQCLYFVEKIARELGTEPCPNAQQVPITHEWGRTLAPGKNGREQPWSCCQHFDSHTFIQPWGRGGVPRYFTRRTEGEGGGPLCASSCLWVVTTDPALYGWRMRLCLRTRRTVLSSVCFVWPLILFSFRAHWRNRARRGAYAAGAFLPVLCCQFRSHATCSVRSGYDVVCLIARCCLI